MEAGKTKAVPLDDECYLLTLSTSRSNEKDGKGVNEEK